MSTFVASKFNADTDPDRPVVGTNFDYNNQVLVIKEVGWVMTSVLLKEVMDNIEPSVIMDPKGHDVCLVKDHVTRPGVQWLVLGDYQNG